MRTGIWRFAVAPSDAAEKNCNIGAQLQSLACIKAPKMFWKIYFLYDFWCTQTCSFRAVFGLPVRTLKLAISAICAEKESVYILGLKLLQWFFFQIPHKRFRQFLDFLQFFDRNFVKIVAPFSNKIANCVGLLEGRSILKKMLKMA